MPIEAFLPQLEKGNCPSPSQSTLALMELLQKEDASLDEAARLIRLDPILVAKTIKLANSPIYRPTRPIVSLDEALMRIGLQVVVRMALGLALITEKLPDAPDFDLNRFWSASLLRAIAMQALAKEIGNWPAGEIFIFGLLSEIGSLMMVCTAPEKSTIFSNKGLSFAERQILEKNEFGFSRHDLTAALMRQWRLRKPWLWLLKTAIPALISTLSTCPIVRQIDYRRLFAFSAPDVVSLNGPCPRHLIAAWKSCRKTSKAGG